MVNQATGSAFLTGAGGAVGGAYGGPPGAVAGAAIGSAAGQALGGSGAVNFRGKYARNQLKHQRTVWQAQREQMSPDMIARVQSVRDAGLHPLAALGITPGSGGGTSAQQPLIPGQNDAGSAIDSGIRAVAQYQRGSNQKLMQGLQVEEQNLRNDWLREQIKNSQFKRLSAAANVTRPAVQGRPHPTEGERRTYMHPDGSTYTVRGGTPAETLESDIGEWADWMPQTLGRGWDAFREQMQKSYGEGAKKFNKEQQIRRNRTKQYFKPAIGSQRTNPRYRR